LQTVAAACVQQGAVLVMDEVTSGWRYGFPGAAPRFGVTPDIAVYAKAMSNGVPAAAIVGRGAVMDSANESFISSSYWTDGIGPAAALACIKKMQRCGAQAHVWRLGERLQQGLRVIADRSAGLAMTIAGQPSAPSLAFPKDDQGFAAKVLLIRKMLARGFMVSTQFYVMLAHDEEMIDTLLHHLSEVVDELDILHGSGGLEREAGAIQPRAGFARLA
jgi:glutamate-1-semialdehyde 2,1-aminomutase